MKKYLLTLALFIYIASAANAQALSGQVIGANGQPLEFANIVLLQLSDSSFISGTTSKSDGSFTMPLPEAKAFVRVSYLGYTTKDLYPQPNMGTIILETDSNYLSEVVVTGHRKMFEMGKEGVLTNVANTPLSKVGTAEDVLKYVPGITKNHDGFNVFGKGTPTFYLNGREMHDLSELDRLSSGEIKSIEVIQTPNSRYDASTRAVVKIRTVRPSGEGLGGGIRSSYWQSQNSDLTEQVDLTYFKDGFYAFGNYKFSQINNLQKSQIKQAVRADTLWNKNDLLEMNNSQKRHELTTGFNYDINKDHSLGMKYILSFAPTIITETHTATSMLANNIPYDNLDTKTSEVYDSNPMHNFNTFYNGKVWGTSVDLNIDYLINRNSNRQSSEEFSEKASRDVFSKSHIKNKMLAAKLVLGKQILNGHFQLGIEATHTTRHDDYTIDGTNVISNANSKLKEVQIAPFAEYERNTPIGLMNIGARYEYVDFKYYKDGILETAQSRSFSNLYPYFSLGTKIGNTTLNLSYSVKTKRPTYRQLSSNISYINRFSLQTGTPTLKSAYIHDVSIMGVWKMIQFMLSWQDNRNAIIYWDEAVPSSSAITKLEYKNLHSLKSLSAMIAIAPSLNRWHPQLSVGLIKQWLQLETRYGVVPLNKPLLQIGFNNSLSLPHSITINLDMNYQSKGNYQNSYLSHQTYILDLSASKSFFKGSLELNIKGSDLLYLRKDTNHLYGNRLEITQNNRYDSRELSITLRYNFNVLKKDYKGRGAGNSEKARM